MKTNEFDDLMADTVEDAAEWHTCNICKDREEHLPLLHAIDKLKESYFQSARLVVKSYMKDMKNIYEMYKNDDIVSFYEFLLDDLGEYAKLLVRDDVEGKNLWCFNQFINKNYPEFAKSDPNILFQLNIILRLVAMDEFNKDNKVRLIESLEKTSNIYALF